MVVGHQDSHRPLSAMRRSTSTRAHHGQRICARCHQGEISRSQTAISVSHIHPRSTQSNPQFLDRPPMANPTPSDGVLRNGLSSQRQQPPPMQHSPFSYPPPAGNPQPPSQPPPGAIHSPQPRMPANIQGIQNPSPDWGMERPPAVQDPNRPSSRPSSFVNTNVNPSSRTSSESPHPYVPNGQHQQR